MPAEVDQEITKLGLEEEKKINLFLKHYHLVINGVIIKDVLDFDLNNTELNHKNQISNNILKCNQCEYTTKWRKHLNMHNVQHGVGVLYECSNCIYLTTHKQHYTRHLLTHSKGNLKQNIQYKCYHCAYETRWKKHLRVHRVTHGVGQLYECKYCIYLTTKREYLEKHTLKHLTKPSDCLIQDTSPKQNSNIENSERQYKCYQCEYTTKCQELLKIHYVQHGKGVLYECEKCNYTTTDRPNFDHHTKIHSKKSKKCAEEDMVLEFKQNSVKNPKQNNKYQCNQCEYTTKWRKNFRIHKVKHGNGVLYKCDQCVYITTDRHHSERHRLSHKNLTQKKYNTINANGNLNIPTDTEYKCNQCDYTTTQNHLLNTHYVTHGIGVLHTCSNCTYTTTQEECFKQHTLTHSMKSQNYFKGRQKKQTIKNFHSSKLKDIDVKIFKCDKCDYSTKNKSCLQSHSLKHSNVKNHKCKLCDYTTKWKQNLKAHFTKHHPD